MDPLQPTASIPPGAVLLLYLADSVPTPEIDALREVFHEHAIADVIGSDRLWQIKAGKPAKAIDIYQRAYDNNLWPCALYDSPLGDVGFQLGANAGELGKFISENPIPGIVLKEKQTTPKDDQPSKLAEMLPFLIPLGLAVGLVAVIMYLSKRG